MNMLNLLNIIRKNDRISRTDLVEKSGLTNGTITNLISELIENNYVVETGNGQSSGGRKPIMLELKAAAGYAVGVELIVARIACVLCDFKGHVIDSMEYAIEDISQKQELLDQIVEMVQLLVVRNHLSVERLLGIGLAVPGPCDYEKGILLNPPNLTGWVNVPICDIIQHRLGVRTMMCKETACAALAEYWFGKYARLPNIFVMHVEQAGIGGAFVAHGEVYQHAHGETMDIGHTTIAQNGGYPCSCGKRGCLEAQANGMAAVRYAKELLADGRISVLSRKEDITWHDVTMGANRGDAVCVEAVKKCARYLSAALGNVICLLDPDVVFLGSSFFDDCPKLFKWVVDDLERLSYPNAALYVIKARYSFGKLTSAIGAVALVLDAFSKSLSFIHSAG